LWDALDETCRGLGITVDEVDEKAGLRRASQTLRIAGQAGPPRSWELRARPLGEGAEGVAVTAVLQDLLALDGGTRLQEAQGEFFGKLEEALRARGLSTDPPAAAPPATGPRKTSPLVWVGAAFVVLAVLVGLSFAGVFSPKPSPAQVAALAPAPASPPTNAKPEEKPMTDLSAVQGSVVKIQTNKGDIVVETFDKETPVTAGNFLELVKSGFYNGVTFHRVVPGFVIQGGDPTGTGGGGPGWTIPLEAKATALTHERGRLSMARTSAPNSAGSQFFICLSTEGVQSLNGQYAVFGKVLQGLDVVDKIVVGDKMSKVTLEKESPDAAAALAAAKKAQVKGGK
jgi:peptidyl-prolyl cis-trans isomerase B (cyclophilin B)